MKRPNPVAKYARQSGARSVVHRDRKRDQKRGYVKHARDVNNVLSY